MATTTQKPKSSAAKEAPPEILNRADAVARARDQAAAEFQGDLKMLATIELEHANVDLTQPSQLMLSASQRYWFARRMDCDNGFAICRELQRARNQRVWREQLKELPEIEKKLHAANADFDSQVPELERQREKLNATIARLASARTEAQSAYDRLVGIREQLRKLCPAAIRDEVDADIYHVKQTNATWRELQQVRDEAYHLVGDSTQAEKLAALRQREAELCAEWKEIIAPIEERIERWVAGKFD